MSFNKLVKTDFVTFSRHSREGGNPEFSDFTGFPVFDNLILSPL
jgi:hypothetical protein